MKFHVTLFMLCAVTAVADEKALNAIYKKQIDRERAISDQIDASNKFYERDLEQMLRAATQAADIASAQALKDQIDSLQHNAVDDLAGTWVVRADSGYTAEVVLNRDGSGTRSDSEKKFYWFIRGKVLFLGLPDGICDQFTLPVREGRASGVNSVRNALVLSKKQ